MLSFTLLYKIVETEISNELVFLDLNNIFLLLPTDKVHLTLMLLI